MATIFSAYVASQSGVDEQLMQRILKAWKVQVFIDSKGYKVYIDIKSNPYDISDSYLLNMYDYRDLRDCLALRYGYYLKETGYGIEMSKYKYGVDFGCEFFGDATTYAKAPPEPLTSKSLQEAIELINKPEKEVKKDKKVFHKLYHHRRLH